MNDATIVTLLSAVPKNLGSQLQGFVGRLGLSRHLIRWYAGKYGVNTEEMEGSLDDYPTLQQFFVRALKPGRRPICPDADALVCPADSKVYCFGTVKDDGHLPDDAGLDFDVVKLVGGDTRYRGGQFAVLYLSPKDYHRVHHPADGSVSELAYLPGALWPVFPAATRQIEGLFAKNERLTVFVETQNAGRIAVVMVGAYGVGRMTTEHSAVVTNTGKPRSDEKLSSAQPVQRGDELGRFNLGSTVILVMEPGTVAWELERGTDVKVGERIGRIAG
ncbi:MAG: phosphatidylserine decarboxylase [Proteobacteria bacterium]|nr:phosphatidylserine decarboxylase [Pseudomonadota bacterium]MCP4918463.1 phosphatidylserine decarboxylase [Pseudomonadota bacterium]